MAQKRPPTRVPTSLLRLFPHDINSQPYLMDFLTADKRGEFAPAAIVRPHLDAKARRRKDLSNSLWQWDLRRCSPSLLFDEMISERLLFLLPFDSVVIRGRISVVTLCTCTWLLGCKFVFVKFL